MLLANVSNIPFPIWWFWLKAFQTCVKIDICYLFAAGGGDDVVHDVDVDVVEDDHVPVGGESAAVVHDVAEDDAVLRGGHLRIE